MSPKRQTYECSQPLRTMRIANTGNNRSGPPTRDQKQKMCHSHEMEYNAATKCKSQLCVAIGVNLTDVTSEDANQAKRQRRCGLIYVKLKVRETHVQ